MSVKNSRRKACSVRGGGSQSIDYTFPVLRACVPGYSPPAPEPDHVLYEAKGFDPDGTLTKVLFFCQGMSDEELIDTPHA